MKNSIRIGLVMLLAFLMLSGCDGLPDFLSGLLKSTDLEAVSVDIDTFNNKITFSVQNNGGESVVDAEVWLYLSPDSEITKSDTYIHTVWITVGADLTQSGEVFINEIDFTGIAESDYYVGIYVDPNDDLGERSRTNNTAASTFMHWFGGSSGGDGGDSDATLSSLSIDPYFAFNEMFEPSRNDYTVTVPYSITSVAVGAVPANPESAVSITGGGELLEGANTIRILVTAPDGMTQEYDITVTRESGVADDDARLLSLSIDPGTLDPAFAAAQLGYSADVENSADYVTVTAVPMNPDSTVTITGADDLVVGDNTISIVVAAPDQQFSK